MRYSAEHRAESRQRILKEAAREIRAKGVEAMGVAAVMARAKLTHGGFYAHFGSRDDLIAEAIGTMFDDVRGRFDQELSRDNPRAALAAYIRLYLTPAHRNSAERGCPLAALASEAQRLPKAARIRFGEGVSTLVGRLADALGRCGEPLPEQAARAMLSQLVGALALARAVSDRDQSLAILEAARDNLFAQYIPEATA